jgi:hypothetical protein
MYYRKQGANVKFIALLLVAFLFIAACEESGSSSSIGSLPAVPLDVRKTEFTSVQSAIALAMIDNSLRSITPVSTATNDMSAFPDTTWSNGLRFTAPDSAGLVLFSHDLVKNDGKPGTTEYMSDQFTRCKYLADESGYVSWVDINGDPTDDAETADCT